MVDWVTYGLLAAVLGFFFFMYLMLRRTFQGFKEGFQQSKKK
jgi:flagellar biogenesis protein FliO